ncbi:MAG TPA: prepilin-type N-terminal cleavage/methylation domain-containing protein [Pseudorhodoferax sp.]|nr:prepilin-type N-terminal cleavage/methylation domain-containing protein [Pseudorhodoferax sp.]
MPSRAPQRGFTLVELLIALAIMATVAVLSWRGLDGMTRTQAATRAYTDEVLTLQAGLAQWTADLDAMLNLQEEPPLDWDGRVLRIVRASTVPGQDGPQVVAWTRRGIADGGQWLRWASPALHGRAALRQAWEQAARWAQTPGTEERRREVAITPLADWRIFYYRLNTWTNPLSTPDSGPGGNNQVEAPDGVRLVLELPPGGPLSGQLTRDWVRPTIGGSGS